jgi:rhamnogalacturonan II specific xylosyltransferase
MNKRVYHKSLYKTFRNKCVILNFFTGGVLDEWRNLLFTLRKLKLDDLILVFPLDKIALEGVKKENIKYDDSLMKDDNIETVTFGGKGFKNITCNKVLAIEKMLKAGYFVFYIDTDIVVKKNFVEHYFTLPPKDCWMQNDHNNFKKSAIATDKHGVVKYNHCSGVMFIAPTAYMIKIMQKAYPEILKVKTGGLTDQKVLNKLIEYKKIGTLDPIAYPNGWRYFSSKKYRGDPYLIHNNWLKGSDKKIKRFKQHKLWYI